MKVIICDGQFTFYVKIIINSGEMSKGKSNMSVEECHTYRWSKT